MRYLRLTISALILTLLLVSVSEGFFFVNSVCFITGTVTVYGKPAVKDLTLTAYINNDIVAEGKTGNYGKFELTIPEYDPAKPEVKGYKSIYDVIQVKLDGKNAKPTFSPVKENLKINLNIETTLDVQLSTWGKIKALFK